MNQIKSMTETWYGTFVLYVPCLYIEGVWYFIIIITGGDAEKGAVSARASPQQFLEFLDFGGSEN